MGRWAWTGRDRGRRAVRSAVDSVVKQFNWRPLERLEQRIPVAGPIAIGATGLWFDQSWLHGLQDQEAGGLATTTPRSRRPRRWRACRRFPSGT